MGKLLIFSAPSGSGKTTIVRRLLEQFSNLEFSISATSRAPRGVEQNGVDYYFLSAEEFAEGHIEDAILIPEYEIADRAEAELPDKDALILVYCRSGRRSKIAAEELVKLGYTDVREFGGIIDWPYETVK